MQKRFYRNFRLISEILFFLSIFIASVNSYAGVPMMTIAYKKLDPANAYFIYSYYPQGSWYACSNGTTIQGAATLTDVVSGSVPSPYFSTPIRPYSSSLTFSPSPPAPIQWQISPYNACIYCPGGNSCLSAATPDSISALQQGTITYRYSSGGSQVFTISTRAALLDNYLPAEAKFTDPSTGEVTNLYFEGCSDYKGGGYLVCCYVATPGNSAACSSNQ